jgi:hypothetical protein
VAAGRTSDNCNGEENREYSARQTDGEGNVYVTGETESVDFPTTPGVIQEHPGKRHCIEGCTDAFVSKIAPSGSALVYSTYLYGELDDAGDAIAVDGSGNAYVMGTTNSGLFPILHAFQHVDRGLDDAFVVKLNPDATRLVYSSYLGGSRSGSSPSTGSDTGTDIVLDAAGNAYELVARGTEREQAEVLVRRGRRVACPGGDDRPAGRGICWVHAEADGGRHAGAARADLREEGVAARAPEVVTNTAAEVRLEGIRSRRKVERQGVARDELIYWSTPNAAAGELPLLLPADLPVGWYELRLLSPAPGSSLPVPIARSEPIRIDGSIQAPPPPGASCDDGAASACDDGDPCTEDTCVPGVGCVSTPVSSFASVTCTCGRSVPAACASQELPASIGGRRQRVCGLLAAAAGAARRSLSRRSPSPEADGYAPSRRRGPLRLKGRRGSRVCCRPGATRAADITADQRGPSEGRCPAESSHQSSG